MLTINKILESAIEVGDIWPCGPLYNDADSYVYALTTTKTDKRATRLLEDWLESRGDILTYDDEVITDEQGRAHWQQPQYYGDMLTFRVFDCWIVAKDEALEDPESYLENLINDESQADTFGIDLESLGFIEADSGESGWHEGQNDTPERMLSRLERKLGPRATWESAYEFVFQIDQVGQFDMRFSLWYRPIKSDDVAA